MKLLIKALFSTFGLEVTRGPVVQPQLQQPERDSHEGSLENAIANGLKINTVLDIGAAFGKWTRMCLPLFPHANFLLIEPLPEYDPWLNSLAEESPLVSRVKAVAASQSGRTAFHVHEDWVGSSLLNEKAGEFADGERLEFEGETVDSIIKMSVLQGPFLIKIDVQGGEIDVLAGSIQSLKETAYLIVECSLYQFYKDGPLLHNVLNFMLEHGFVLYDILQRSYRPLDKALAQVDLVFVPEESPLRSRQLFFTDSQREAWVADFKDQHVATK